ncbi:4-hydroxyphenylpyruvate dioxygenase [Piscirickettsia litoralis]|uniref:4-hydroxyphenylpyruvate dioxygenase n=1 Tax=Piscirickettsia litoralis TaxID=1891921 RepID=A0ABX3A3Z4_9GAMM|nr:4-hydroxyphenylpyruvate dioxygenase [Piscirickettsia litoralis]ODN43173.1 4-hydroxyphenylpyruvate dioxygenase [Piscirickettsia litoralis]
MTDANAANVGPTTTINPMQTQGFSFLEFTASKNPEHFTTTFTNLGFSKIAVHARKDVELWKQGNIHFLVNRDSNSASQKFSDQHGPCTSAMGFRVKDASFAFERAVELGAEVFTGEGVIDVPAIYGIGGSVLYFVSEDYDLESEFEIIAGVDMNSTNMGLVELDHVTHNVLRGNMDKWAGFYEKLFNFREIRYFDIEGKLTGLKSRAMTSPCGKIRIPINESSDDKSQIEEFINEFNGEGIQHIALTSSNIYKSVENIRSNGVTFLDTPDTYYEGIAKRVPWHSESVEDLHKNKILIDGAPTADGGLLLQIFTDTVIGPAFFEIIQRKGDEGFGEGNFQALFDSIELDQVRRGVLKDE